MSRLVVVGDVLLDRDVDGDVSRLTPDAPAPVLDERSVRSRPGGAGLAALLGVQDGHEVVLVTALPSDPVGDEVARLLADARVRVVDLGLAHPLGEKIRLRSGGVSLARWDRGGRSSGIDVGEWSGSAEATLVDAEAVLVCCYGRGVAAATSVRAALGRAVARCPVVWDPHPRGEAPVAGVTVATPNHDELGAVVGMDADPGLAAVTAASQRLRDRWEVGSLVVTMGAQGALLTSGYGLPAMLPAPVVSATDSCGAGDRFASRLAGALADGEVVSEAVRRAVASASAFVAAGGASTVRIGTTDRSDHGGGEDPFGLAARVRAEGGTVVATGGCFDLLHPGHVHLLEAARALGDCLVVCLNDDASVRRLKGPGRPIVAEEDRAALLRALSSVDAVAIFAEDTPVEALRRLRPDVFAKGGDYGAVEIPEAAVVAGWGGQAVTLPYLHGRSTTHILEEVQRREP